MATAKFILQQPYKTTNAKVRATGQPSEDNALDVKRSGKKKEKTLNPYPTRLYCFQIIDRKHTIKIKTEHAILPADWDFKKQLKKENLAGALEFNKRLLTLKADLLDKYEKLRADNPSLSFEEVSELMKAYGKSKEIPFDPKGFYPALDEFILSMKGQLADRTVAKFKTLKTSLIDFGEKNKRYKKLSFGLIGHSFLDAYTSYLREREPKGRQKRRPEGHQSGLLIDTVDKYVKSLKTFCKWAEERKYNNNPAYKQFSSVSEADKKRKKQPKDIVTLTLPELKQFCDHDFSGNPSFERVRDLFAFEVYTGQRWSDIERFDKSQLHGDVWKFTAFKTKKKMEIDLIGFQAGALDILRKYNYQLPKISLQKYNDYLKLAAAEAGINTPTSTVRYVGSREILTEAPKSKFISSHTGRKTCFSILLNDYNISVSHVMAISGHSDLKTLQAYINPDRQARRDAIGKTKPISEVMRVVKTEAV